MRTWVQKFWNNGKDVVLAKRDDGQKFYMKAGTCVDVWKEIDTYLHEGCTCSIPPAVEACGVHAQIRRQ